MMGLNFGYINFVILTIGLILSLVKGIVPNLISIVVILYSVIMIIITLQWSRLLKEKNEGLEELRELATIDSLTSIYNRMTIDEILDAEINRAHRYASPMCVLFIDIDYFKNINDTYGHVQGDKVLIKVAQLLKRNIRSTDSMGRWGGEEFVIITPEIELIDAHKMAKKLNRLIADYGFQQDSEVTISIGIAELGKDDIKETIINRADKALYKAKENGRNRVELASLRMDFLFHQKLNKRG